MTQHPFRTQRFLSLITFAAALCLSTVASAATAASVAAATNDQPCAASPETRQLDYWLGRWTMGTGADQTSSQVTLSLDKCVFTERWENGKGHVTEKMFAYSPEDKSWYGMFVDNQGRVHVFVDGKVSSTTAEFRSPSKGPNGESVLNRLKVTRLAPDKLEELWEKSTDQGTTWTTAYRAEYSRANP
jgi:hypothetical protein